MPVLAAPLQSLGIIGTATIRFLVPVRTLTLPAGFVLLGVPVYYATQKNEDMPRVFGACGNFVGLILPHGEIFSPRSKFLRQIQKQTRRWFWMAGRRD